MTTIGWGGAATVRGSGTTLKGGDEVVAEVIRGRHRENI